MVSRARMNGKRLPVIAISGWARDVNDVPPKRDSTVNPIDVKEFRQLWNNLLLLSPLLINLATSLLFAGANDVFDSESPLPRDALLFIRRSRGVMNTRPRGFLLSIPQ